MAPGTELGPRPGRPLLSEPPGRAADGPGRSAKPTPDRPAAAHARRAPRRVALLGAESTGKTNLAAALGGRLGGIVVAEYLREFCHHAGRVPRADEQAGIVAEQLRREHLAAAAAAEHGVAWVICDTSPLMVALYSIDCFEDSSLVAGAIEWQHGYAATLVCLPDIDWVADGIQRVGPRTRERIHHGLVALLDAHRVAWHAVSGSGEARVDSAMAVLARLD